MRALGTGRAAPVPRHVRVRPRSTSAPASLLLARDPLGIKPLYVMPRGDGVALRVRAEGARERRRARAHGRTRGPWSPRCSTTGCPRRSPRSHGRVQAARRARGRGAGRTAATARTGTGTPPTRPRPRPRQEPPPTSRAGARGVGHRAPRRRRAGRHVPSAAAWTPASSPRWRTGTTPSIEAYTITFRPEDQRLEAMPDDAVYARKVAAHFGIKLHEIEISPDVVDLLPRIVDILDEPIGDPAAINTVLMCRGRPRRGRQGAAVGHGRRRAVRRLPQAPRLPARRAATRACPAPVRSRVVAPAVDRLPGRRGGPRAAVQPLGQALPHLRGAAGGGGVPAQLHAVRRATSSTALLDPALAAEVDAVLDGAPRPLHGRRPRRPRQPDVPHRRPAVPARAQPRLHRPVEHGGVDRGPGAVRRPGGLRGGVRDPRQPRRSGAAPQKVALREAAQEWLPSEIVDRPKASFGAPLRAWVTNDLGPLHRRRAARRRARGRGRAAARAAAAA